MTMDNIDGSDINIQDFFNDEDELDDDENEDNIEIDSNGEQAKANVKPTKQRSSVWAHYHEIIEDDVKYAVCNHCKK